jgi:endonuclease/exonuclease/phosphatase family metal-dependent hydrolase
VHEKLIYDAYKSSRMSVVLFGDFNCKSSDRKAYEMLLKLGDCSDRSVTMRDLSKSEEPTYDTVNNELAEDKEAHGRIDYVFSIERLQTPSEVFEFVPVEAHWLAQGHRGYENCCKDIDIDYSISDHYPNIVRLEWNSKVQ